MKPTTPGRRQHAAVHGRPRRAARPTSIHQSIIANAFACDITRVACLAVRQRPEADGQRAREPACPTTISTAASSTAAPSSNFANLVKFEAYLATQFVTIINLLKGLPGPGRRVEDAVRHTLMVWARDMGDADQHNQQSMRFVLASGNGGYLKTGRGRPLRQVDRAPRAHPAQRLRGDGHHQLRRLRRSGPDRNGEDAAAEHRRVGRGSARAPISVSRRAERGLEVVHRRAEREAHVAAEARGALAAALARVDVEELAGHGDHLLARARRGRSPCRRRAAAAAPSTLPQT